MTRHPYPKECYASIGPSDLDNFFHILCVQVFGLSGSPKAKDAYRTSEETELMDCIGLNGELGGLTPQTVIRQTKYGNKVIHKA